MYFEFYFKYIYDAWGNHICRILSNNGEYVDNSDNETYNYISNINPFRYRGYYYDTETGLYYLNSRYYDPQTGRFINADSIENIDTENLNGFNLYMYCANNPIINIDKDGNAWWNPFSWNWKKIGKVVLNIISSVAAAALTVALVAGGIALTIYTGGAFAHLGALMIGAGIGGLIGGIQNKLDGGLFWAGYLGGFVSGAITALSSSLGVPFIGGFIGNIAGTIITDAINGNYINDSNYWLNLIGESLLAGIINIGATKFGDASKVLNIQGFRHLFAGITVWAEFASSYLYDQIKLFLRGLSEKIRKQIL